MAAKTAGREKRPLGDLFGLTNFGVNLTRLAPGAYSALRHAHAKQDEFVYIIAGSFMPVSDSMSYPDNDVVAVFGADGKWKYTRKDGTPY